MLETIWHWCTANTTLAIIGAITVIQIVPIKVDPWTWVAKKVRTFLVGDLNEELKRLKHEVMEDRVSNVRWLILNFANATRQGRLHTKEEWDHCIDQIAWYEAYCEKNDITNGVIVECSEYLRTLYHQDLEDNNFLS